MSIFDGLGQYAEVAKWTIYLSILTLIIGVLGSIYNRIEQSGYDRAMLQVAAEAEKRNKENEAKFVELANVKDEEPAPVTVTDIVEVIKYVNVEVEKPVYVCSDLGDEFIRVRNKTRDRIFDGEDSNRDSD